MIASPQLTPMPNGWYRYPGEGVDYNTPPTDPRWSYHDLRCMGECERCYGADACGLVGHSCIPCAGCLPNRFAPITGQTFPC